MAISASTTYEILPLEDVTLAVEVQGNGTANKANVRLYTRNGSNAQKWRFEPEGTEGVWYITDAETDKVCEVFKGIDMDKDGANVSMYTANQSVAQKWLAIQVGTQEINGTAYETYQFVAFGGTQPTQRCMDVAGSGSEIRANIQIWKRVAGHPSQTFALFPTEWNAVGGTGNDQAILSVPSDGTCGAEVGTSMGTTTALTAGTIYPAWTCDETMYQVRWRKRVREDGAAAPGEWGDWNSISGSGTAFDGFGAPGVANCTPELINGTLWASEGVTVNNGDAYDRTDIQFTARSWVADWGVYGDASAHGGEYTWEVNVLRPVAVTDVSATFGVDGLTIGYQTNSSQKGSTVTVSSPLFGSVTAVSDGSGSITVPLKDLASVPASGQAIEVDTTFTTAEGLTVADSSRPEVSYDGSQSDSFNLQSTVSGSIATVTSAFPDAEAYLVVPRGHGDRLVPIPGKAPWKVPAPLGVPWQILALRPPSKIWNVYTFDPIVEVPPTYHVTSQDLTRDWAVSYHSDEEGPSFDVDYERDSETFSTTGRERPVNVFGGTTTAKWSLEGELVGKDMSDETYDFDWASHAGHVYFRSPRGFWAQAGVMQSSVELGTRRHHEVSMTFSEEWW